MGGRLGEVIDGIVRHKREYSVHILVIDHTEHDVQGGMRGGFSLLFKQGSQLGKDILKSMAVMSGIADCQRLIGKYLPSSTQSGGLTYVLVTLRDGMGSECREERLQVSECDESGLLVAVLIEAL